MENRSLGNLKIGEGACISRLVTGCQMRRRLLDLGFTHGAFATCLYMSPTGNPRAYLIRGTVIALRNEDAHAVLVSDGRGEEAI